MTFEEALRKKAEGDAALAYLLHGDDQIRTKAFWAGYAESGVAFQLSRAAGPREIAYDPEQYTRMFLAAWDALAREATIHTERMTTT